MQLEEGVGSIFCPLKYENHLVVKFLKWKAGAREKGKCEGIPVGPHGLNSLLY